jgi:hypothetical protein
MGSGIYPIACPALSVGATKMEKALLQNLIAGAGSSSQLIGGLIVALLYVRACQ